MSVRCFFWSVSVLCVVFVLWWGFGDVGGVCFFLVVFFGRVVLLVCMVVLVFVFFVSVCN